MSSPNISIAAAIMGQALGGIAIARGLDFSGDFNIDHVEDRVWAKIRTETGDVYELSARWVGEESP